MAKKHVAAALAVGGALALTLAFAPTIVNAESVASALNQPTTIELAHRGGRSSGLIAATASVTGLTEAEVRAAVQAGQTLTEIAEANGSTAEAVIAAARTALVGQLTQAVADGSLTQVEADAKLASFDANATAQMTSTGLDRGRGPRGGGLGGHVGGTQGLIAATASVTGLTEAEVRAAVQSGQTLAQIAEANGATSEAVIAAARAALETQLSTLVTDGRLTQVEADAKLAGFDATAAEKLTQVLTFERGPGRRGPGDGTTTPNVPTTPTPETPTSSS